MSKDPGIQPVTDTDRLLARCNELEARALDAERQRDALQQQLEERETLEADALENARHLRMLEEANRRLLTADRYKDEFLSVLSHELRTPLNFILGFASVLDDEIAGPLDDMQHEYLGKIMTGAGRMLHLVEDLLDIARIQAGKIGLMLEPYPYETLVKDVLATLEPLFTPKQLTVTADIQAPGNAVIDSGRVTQVLTNLLSNATKFTPTGGRITVTARIEGDELVTRVTDSGPGIAPEDVNRLFTRFSQLDMSATRSVGGTGLGLAISKALVEAHGGRIGVLSEHGHGCTFWFALPLVPHLAETLPEA